LFKESGTCFEIKLLIKTQLRVKLNKLKNRRDKKVWLIISKQGLVQEIVDKI